MTAEFFNVLSVEISETQLLLKDLMLTADNQLFL